jgi:hypothetical protein
MTVAIIAPFSVATFKMPIYTVAGDVLMGSLSPQLAESFSIKYRACIKLTNGHSPRLAPGRTHYICLSVSKSQKSTRQEFKNQKRYRNQTVHALKDRESLSHPHFLPASDRMINLHRNN